MILRAPTSPKQRSCERTSARRSQSIAVDRVKPLSRWTFEKSGLGRVAHGLGMDGGAFGGGRIAGTLITMLTLLGLGIWAVITALA
jgi:hypothetical protein